jgi:TPR repeat protein
MASSLPNEELRAAAQTRQHKCRNIRPPNFAAWCQTAYGIRRSLVNYTGKKMNHYKNLIKLILSLLFLFNSVTASAVLSQEQQAAKERGISLYKQEKNAERELRIAAEAGDAEAQFYLAQQLRQMELSKALDSKESVKWFVASANQGNLFSLYQLSHNVNVCVIASFCPKGEKSRGEWDQEYKKTLMEKFASNDLQQLGELNDWVAKSDVVGEWFHLQDELRYAKNHRVEDTREWLVHSANQGNFNSLLRLALDDGDKLCTIVENCPKGDKTQREWKSEFEKIAREKIASGDMEAAYLLYVGNSDFNMLIKSAEGGYPFAQYQLAESYSAGDGFFWWFGQRRKEINKWYKRAAENGYPKAMIAYAASIYEDNGDLSISRYWLEESAKAGDSNGVGLLAREYASNPNYYGFPFDMVKAYGLTLLLAGLDNDESDKEYDRERLEEYSKKMTPEQIEQGKAFAEKWKVTHRIEGV